MKTVTLTDDEVLLVRHALMRGAEDAEENISYADTHEQRADCEKDKAEYLSVLEKFGGAQ